MKKMTKCAALKSNLDHAGIEYSEEETVSDLVPNVSIRIINLTINGSQGTVICSFNTIYRNFKNGRTSESFNGMSLYKWGTSRKIAYGNALTACKIMTNKF